jgi:putative SOS response-associated peptidase YedK
MCGRFTLKTTPEVLKDQFKLKNAFKVKPRYNIAPSQQVAGVRMNGEEGDREGVLFRWGLIPAWAKDPAIGMKLINARAETVAEKPSFRGPFRHRRCLVLVDGYYEWQKVGRTKQPYLIRFGDERPFAFGGLWDRWTDPECSKIETCTLMTTEPNELMKPIHNRMPVIIQPQDYEMWLDPEVQKPEQVQHLLRPYPAKEMVAYPVSLRVNNPRNDDSDCLEPVELNNDLISV